MKFGKNIDQLREKRTKTFFAWLPITVKGETRWLETVTVKGYYFVGSFTGSIRFAIEDFVD